MEKAYTYSITNEQKLKVSVGFIYEEDFFPDTRSFYYEFPSHGKKKMTVSREPYRVYNGIIWSYEPDDKLALEKLATYYIAKRSSHLASADKCFYIYKMLKEEILK